MAGPKFSWGLGELTESLADLGKHLGSGWGRGNQRNLQKHKELSHLGGKKINFYWYMIFSFDIVLYLRILLLFPPEYNREYDHLLSEQDLNSSIY